MIENKFRIVTWEYFKSLVKQSLNVDFKTIDNFFMIDTVLHNWSELDESEIFECLSSLKQIEGSLFVVTDASYRSNLGPFQVDATNLKDFIREHENYFGEPFLDTDILIVSIQQKVAWVIHHEGVYALIDFN